MGFAFTSLFWRIQVNWPYKRNPLSMPSGWYTKETYNITTPDILIDSGRLHNTHNDPDRILTEYITDLTILKGYKAQISARDQFLPFYWSISGEQKRWQDIHLWLRATYNQGISWNPSKQPLPINPGSLWVRGFHLCHFKVLIFIIMFFTRKTFEFIFQSIFTERKIISVSNLV